MSEDEIPLSQHDRLAMAVAQGKSITAWARQNGVPRRTAQRWAAEPDVRRQVEDWRRRVLDRALGYMAGRSMWRPEESPSSEQPPSPSPFSSGRGGPCCTTRLLSPSSRISNTAWPSSRSKSVFAMETRLTRVKAGLGPLALGLAAFARSHSSTAHPVVTGPLLNFVLPKFEPGRFLSADQVTATHRHPRRPGLRRRAPKSRRPRIRGWLTGEPGSMPRCPH
jgi:hypothetical protein